jgi:hypothetical protein
MRRQLKTSMSGSESQAVHTKKMDKSESKSKK